MGFYDNPIIDQAAKHSETSERALRNFFNMENGFICRVPVPDKGCDFDVELILDNSDAAKWDFGIQLKSTASLHLTDNSQYISFSFETSRLGYLLRDIPVPGIIVIHSSETGLCYFSEVSVILEKLWAQKSNAWENQKTVQIKIPVEDILNAETTQAIHQKYVSLFKNAARMQDAFGGKYGLAKSGFRQTEQYDLQNPAHIASFLQECGTDLLINYEVNTVATLIKKLTDTEIASDTKLLCLAAIANAEMGIYDISELQCNKAIKRKDISVDDKRLVKFALIKNQFHLGKITFEQVNEQLVQFQGDELSPQNKLTIRFNLLYFKLALINIGDDLSAELLKDIMDLFDDISNAGLVPRVSLLLTVWNADNFSSYINAIFMHEIGLLSLSEAGLGVVGFSHKIALLNTQLLAILEKFQQEKTTGDQVLIRAHALQIWVKHHLHLELTTLNMKPTQNNFEGREGSLIALINMALSSSAYFQQEGFIPESYISLCYAIEFIELGKSKFGKMLYPNLAELSETKTMIEEDTAIKPYEFQILTILENKAAGKPVKMIKSLSQPELKTLVSMISKARNMTEQSAMNVLKEMGAFQEFHTRCKNPDIDLKPIYHTLNGKDPNYAIPVRYFLQNNKTGVQSLPSPDIEQLLAAWGL